MSSDLLAEFDSFYRAPQKTATSKTPTSNDLSLLGGGNGEPVQGTASQPWRSSGKPSDDIWGIMGTSKPPSSLQPMAVQTDDIWGSFGSSGMAQQPKPTTTYGGANTVQGRIYSQQDNPRILRRPTLDMFSQTVLDSDTAPTRSKAQEKYTPTTKPPVVTKNSHTDVLFDAEMNGFDDDEFGEFETVSPPPPPSELQLKSLDAKFGSLGVMPRSSLQPSNNLNTIQPSPQTALKNINILTNINLSNNQTAFVKDSSKPQSTPPATSWLTFEPVVSKTNPPLAKFSQKDDSWGRLAAMAPGTPIQPVTASPDIGSDAWGWDTVQVSETTDIPPPANIPPPSVLLTLFPPIFDLPQSALFKPVASQPFSLKNRIISDPSTIEFLHAYLLIGVVAARIITGRKLRWKRDALLSQAMKIGPAAAGGKGGMKLTGIDKTEATREDREAAEVVRLWKDQVGRLRSAVAVANSSIHDASKQLAIPDVSENMHIKSQVGGLTAPKACIVCGLKREERINKVDVDVEDSFGEWWTEHWGHRACRNFWLKHEPALLQR